MEQPIGLPPSLLMCASEVKNEGGTETLYNLLDKVQQLSLTNAEVLDEVIQGVFQYYSYLLQSTYRHSMH